MKLSIINLVGFVNLLSLASNAAASSSTLSFLHTVVRNDSSVLGLNMSADETPLDFGSIVQFSNDGVRLAVGASLGNNISGAIFVFERFGSIDQPTWTEIFKLHDNCIAGDMFSLSGDGQILAVRRLHGDVSVYQYVETVQSFIMIGKTVPNVCIEGGKALSVGQTGSDTAFGEAKWLLISCEFDNRHTGKIELMKYNETAEDWQSFTSVPMPDPRIYSHFGWQTSFHIPTHKNQPLLIATSAASWEGRRGMVRVFQVDASGSWQKLGQDLTGEVIGEEFGFSLAVSSGAGRPFMVVGAPTCSDDRDKSQKKVTGCVRVYGLASTNRDGYQWSMIGEPLYGIDEDDSLGRSVAINENGTRVVAASYMHDSQRGLVMLFERDPSGNAFQLLASFVTLAIQTLARWGQAVTMDQSASMIASASPRFQAYAGALETAKAFAEQKLGMATSPRCNSCQSPSTTSSSLPNAASSSVHTSAPPSAAPFLVEDDGFHAGNSPSTPPSLATETVLENGDFNGGNSRSISRDARLAVAVSSLLFAVCLAFAAVTKCVSSNDDTYHEALPR